MKRAIYAKVKDCELAGNAYFEFVASLAEHDGKDIVITIDRKRKKRSQSINSYYWGVVIPAVMGILTEYGNDVDEEDTHTFCKEHIGKLTGSVVGPKGNRLAITKSSASLETTEFRAYLDRIIRWAATENVFIADPNEHLLPPKESY